MDGSGPRKIRPIDALREVILWALQDLNLRPLNYEFTALTN